MMLTYQGVRPTVGPACFVAPNAILVGSVRLDEKASVWFGAVLRGDVAAIRIGATSNVQDGVIIHADPGFPVEIGRGVTIGHAAKLHGCTVEDGALIGIGATVLDGAVIGKQALIGANALIPPGKIIPERALVMGSPGKIVRMLTDDEVKELAWASEEYVRTSAEYLSAPAVPPG
ncbi:gamma carbonic anhydrase family protein [Burkholderia pyrrocinia]|uniref:gamma carbonic anhydrase family protein n=1 Tax=Burkholderia pyrrocinia TaxID=60550 RepID=UPI00158A34FD|nr:gamma carbonic anhydrase family protein [Burkholderia pyrrocinia]